MTITALLSHPIPDDAPSSHQGVGVDEGSEAHLLVCAQAVYLSQRRIERCAEQARAMLRHLDLEPGSAAAVKRST